MLAHVSKPFAGKRLKSLFEVARLINSGGIARWIEANTSDFLTTVIS